VDEGAVTLLAMFESCHHSGNSEGRCADVAEKLAQLFGWRQTYKVEKLQRSLADSVARRNELQQRQQLHQSQEAADTVRNRKVSDSSYSQTELRGTKGLIIMTWHVWETGEVQTGVWWEDLMERGQLKDLDVDVRIILKWFFKKLVGEGWAGSILLRIGTGGEVLRVWFRKMRGIF
jgi:hypothetical protein